MDFKITRLLRGEKMAVLERNNPVADNATDENLELGVETTAAAPEPSPKGEDPSIANMSVGEVLSTFSPNSNRAAERIYEQYNPDQLVQANDPTINGYAVENRTNNYFSYLDDLFDEFAGLSEEEKKQKRLEASLAEAMIDAHEEKMEQQRKELSQQDRDILSNQRIRTADGRSLSVLDIVDSLDNMLDNWDNTFDDMVDQGIADPKDKKKLYKNMLRYRNMMADPSLSEAEKQRQREQMIHDGLLTQDQVNWLDHRAENEESGHIQTLTSENITQRNGSQKDSTSERADDAKLPCANTSNSPQFAMSASCEITADQNPTKSFNQHSGIKSNSEPPPQLNQTPISNRQVAANTTNVASMQSAFF